MKSFSKPTNEQVEKTVPQLSSPQHERYFFDRLNNPEWIEPLNRLHFFSNPLATEKVVGGGIRFPPWPPSRYLARMAEYAPNEVVDIFAKMDTDNASVVGDLLDAARKMLPEVAARIVPAVCKAISLDALIIHFDDASDLCVQLASGGQAEAAMTLAESLFGPRSASGRDVPLDRDEYWYKLGLQNVVPALVPVSAQRLIPKLCDWLLSAVEAKGRVDQESWSDYSYVWRPAIEEHDQNESHEFTGELVGFVRQAFEQAINDGYMSLKSALSVLDTYSYLVFKRLRVHLINVFAEMGANLARKTMMERSLFKSHEFKHEYTMLVGERLTMLRQSDREMWFGWVEAGPDMPQFDKSFDLNMERAPTDEERQARLHYWQFERLHWVRKHLDGKRLVFYTDMLAKYGQPDLADLNIRSSDVFRVTQEPPFTVEDLKTLSFVEAIDRIAEWRPDRSTILGPSFDGLESVFREYVASNPDEFSKDAHVLQGRSAVVVQTFIESMSEAAKVCKELDIVAVLRLCDWVVGRSAEQLASPTQDVSELGDKNWNWTRDSVCHFVQNVCAAKVEDRPRYPLKGIREPVWRILGRLTRDPAKSYGMSSTDVEDPRVHDYMMMAINSSRGKAVKAALEYARWIANHMKDTEDGQEVVRGGLSIMPEFKAMLEWQIAPENGSLEASALIGSNLSLLYWIDRSWIAGATEHLFDLRRVEQEPANAYGWAAWNAFLVWGRPHIEYYKLLKPQFAYAVRQSFDVQMPQDHGEQPMYRLGMHLVILYVRGELTLEDDNKLLRRFITEAIPEIRCRAIRFAGNCLDPDDDLPHDVIDRLTTLWEWYWSEVGRDDAAQNQDGYLFGAWFVCGQFPDDWCLEQLEQFVNVVPVPEPDDLVVDRLAEIASTHITRATGILDRMIRDGDEVWRFHRWQKPVRSILCLAMEADGAVREQAAKLIDHLGRLGYADFGELLEIGR